MDASVARRKKPSVTDRYQFDKKIGEGTFGKVFKATEISSKKLVAIKVFKTKDDQTNGISFTTCREISLLQELKQENIVRLKDVILEPQKKALYLVFEYAEYDLFAIIKGHHKRRMYLPEGLVKSLLWQILNGMNYLHMNWIIHRDLKPSNILVMGKGSSEGVVKIADFGLARFFQAPLRPLSDNGVVVTIWYRAPELLLGSKHYTRAIDIWAIGCIFGELLLNSAIFQGNEDTSSKAFQIDQIQKIFEVMGTLTVDHWNDAQYLPHWGLCKDMNYPRRLDDKLRPRTSLIPFSPRGSDLLQQMLEYDPSKRITAEKALMHAYFSEEPIHQMNSLSYVSDKSVLSLPDTST